MTGIKEKSKRYNLHSWAAQGALDPTVITRANGIYFWDEEGKRYYDMSSQLVNSNLGHGNEALVKAIKDQADRIPFIGPGYAVDVRSEAAELIVKFAGSSFEGGKVFFTNAGADANENAIKICKQYTGRWKILSMYNSYHGSSFGASSLTGEGRRFSAEPGVPGFFHFDGPYAYRAPSQVSFESEADVTSYYMDRLKEAIMREGADLIAGIFMETVVGSNGVLIPPAGYLRGAQELCNRYGIMLVLDEVMAGFYRTGSKFAFHGFDVNPDIVTFAKGSTCGYVPLGGVIVKREIADYFDEHKMWNGLTYSAHPIGAAVAIAAISEYERLGIAANVKAVGEVLGELLDELMSKHVSIGQVRYIGLFSQVELVKNRVTKEKFNADEMAKIIKLLMNAGFATYSNDSGIMIAPPLIIGKDELRTAMAIFDKVLDEADKLAAN